MNDVGKEFEAMFVGRFQPFHNGHLQAIKSILKECKNLLVVIGSSQESGTEKNPFKFELRKQLIESCVDDRVSVIDLPDIKNDDKWVQYLVESVPKFKFVYTGSDETKKLFELDGRFEVRNVDFLQGVNATLIREKIQKKQNVQDLVPYEVDKILQ